MTGPGMALTTCAFDAEGTPDGARRRATGAPALPACSAAAGRAAGPASTSGGSGLPSNSGTSRSSPPSSACLARGRLGVRGWGLRHLQLVRCGRANRSGCSSSPAGAASGACASCAFGGAGLRRRMLLPPSSWSVRTCSRDGLGIDGLRSAHRAGVQHAACSRAVSQRPSRRCGPSSRIHGEHQRQRRRGDEQGQQQQGGAESPSAPRSALPAQCLARRCRRRPAAPSRGTRRHACAHSADRLGQQDHPGGHSACARGSVHFVVVGS